MGLALFPIIALWLNTESLLLLAQQTPCVARLVYSLNEYTCRDVDCVIVIVDSVLLLLKSSLWHYRYKLIIVRY